MQCRPHCHLLHGKLDSINLTLPPFLGPQSVLATMSPLPGPQTVSAALSPPLLEPRVCQPHSSLLFQNPGQCWPHCLFLSWDPRQSWLCFPLLSSNRTMGSVHHAVPSSPRTLHSVGCAVPSLPEHWAVLVMLSPPHSAPEKQAFHAGSSWLASNKRKLEAMSTVCVDAQGTGPLLNTRKEALLECNFSI